MYSLPVLDNIQKKLLDSLICNINKIEPVSEKYRILSKKHWDSIAKPLDGLGEFECIFQKLSSIQESEIPKIGKKSIVVMCSDNGVVEEGISQSTQDVTLAVTKSMANGTSSVAVLTKSQGVELTVVDIGINTKDTDIYSSGVINRKLMHGTNNFLKERAMPIDIALRAILCGVNIVKNHSKQGINIIGTGEMGIGNTTTSSAMAAVLLSIPADNAAGRGAGLCDAALLKKIEVINRGIHKYGFNTEIYYKFLNSDKIQSKYIAIIDLLSSLGGLDIAGLCGIYLGCAIYRVPVVVDGVISEVAALLAYHLISYCKEYMIASHLSREPVAGKIFDILDLKPVINASLALGEGSGCAMLFPLLDMAGDIYSKNASFCDIEIEEYKRFI